MKTKIIIVLLCLLINFLIGCNKSESHKRDILMKAVLSFEDEFDTPYSKGKNVFDRYCSVCHGVEGKGDGFNAYNLNPNPRNFADTAFLSRLDSSLIVETITNGGKAVGLSSLMPSWGNTLSDTSIKFVTNYVLSLARTAADSSK